MGIHNRSVHWPSICSDSIGSIRNHHGKHCVVVMNMLHSSSTEKSNFLLNTPLCVSICSKAIGISLHAHVHVHDYINIYLITGIIESNGCHGDFLSTQLNLNIWKASALINQVYPSVCVPEPRVFVMCVCMASLYIRFGAMYSQDELIAWNMQLDLG